MTRIRFRFRRPDASHVSGVPVEGVISCNPTMRVVQEDESLLLPVPFAVRLPSDGGDLTLDLKPTGVDWCWRIEERIKGLTHVRRVIVPDSTQILDYATLSEAAWRGTSDCAGGLAHSIRVFAGVIGLGDVVDVDDLRPSDHVSAGDSVVDAEGAFVDCQPFRWWEGDFRHRWWCELAWAEGGAGFEFPQWLGSAGCDHSGNCG
nr:MAG TPA: hypothetical protein [Caudoviricetes sp.]